MSITDVARRRGDARTTDHAVLLDVLGRPSGTVPKAAVHGSNTPLHLAFSCHIVRDDGAVLLTRRSLAKATWPGCWTNGCCGHPQLGASLGDAVRRRVFEELGLDVVDLAVALPDFAYRAEMDDGTVEHELCPVLVASVAGSPSVDPDEVAEWRWASWPELVRRAQEDPASLSPWSVEQVRQLAAAGVVPAEWLAGASGAGLDRPITVGAPVVGARQEPGRSRPEGAGTPDPRAARVVAEPVDAILDRFLAAKLADPEAPPGLAGLAVEVRSLVEAGGKRLRPAFTYWGHRATGAPHDPEVLNPAAAMELLHTFALIHDDVMDRSATRRGRVSAFAAYAAAHRRTGQVGDSAWFGVSAAILAGDLAFVWADELLEAGDVPTAARARARDVFQRLRSEVIVGQYRDLALAAAPAPDELAARQVALLKSARYTVTRPLLLGAALAGGPPDATLEVGLRAYGDAIGVAFQVRDDILGVFGDPEVTGKSRLDDLREGKRTILALRALRLATPAGRAVLERSLGDADLDEVAAARCREVVASSGALASAEALVADHLDRALLAIADLPEPSRQALTELAWASTDRRR